MRPPWSRPDAVAAPGSPLPQVLQLVAMQQRPFEALERWRTRHGPRFVVRVPGMPPLVFLAEREDAEAVFAASPDVLHAGEGGRAIEPIVGPRAFVLADGDEHLHARMLLREAFSRATAERHAAMLRERAEREVATWPADEPLALHPRFRTFALDAILRTIFGEDAPELPELTGRLLRMLEAASSPVLGAPPTRHLPPYRGVWRRFLRDRAEADALLYGLIDARRRAGGGGERDTLGLLVDGVGLDGRPTSREYVRDCVTSVLLAGHETTSSSLAWAFALLAHRPDVQARIAEDPEPEARGSITTAAISEVLRHRSVFVFAIPRAVVAPFALPGGATFTAPAHLLPCIYLMHHDPRHYAQPDEFRPERFLTTPPDRSIWLPWGGGRRRCPGRHLALIELRTVLRAAFRRFRVEPAGPRLEPPRWRAVIVSPRDGARVVLRRR